MNPIYVAAAHFKNKDNDKAHDLLRIEELTRRAVGEGAQIVICIRADGEVKKRKKVKAEHGTSHTVGVVELQKVCDREPDVLVIGTGYDDLAELTDEGRAFLQEKGITVREVPTPEVADAYNQAEGRNGALIHVTC